jgi:signal transduction histidine kinase
MDIYTRQASNQPWLHVEIDWDAFDDMTKFMDEIIVKHNYLDKIPGESHEIKVGTSIVISRLQLNWLGRIPGPKRSGRSEYRLGRLSEDLTILVRPLDIGPGDFAITLDSDLVPDDSVKLGTITPEAAIREAPYHYQFEVFLDKKNGATVNRTLRRSAAFAKDFGKKRVENLKPASIEWIIDQTGSSEKHSVDSASPLPCGPFKGSFLYLPPRARQRASSEEVVGHGVLLYRDGVLVEPYGLRGNDWIGAEARKAQRQGHAPIQPDTFWGEVEISRDSNPLLRDTANRQGLLDNDASAIFLAIIREEFSTFESEILDEIESRWLSREERAAEVAEQQITAVVLRTRTFAHHLRQPLVGIAGELTSLKRLAKSFEMTDAQKSRFNDIVKRLEDYFQRSENLVNEYAKSRVPEFRDVSTDEILALVKSACVEIAVDHSASLVFENGKRMEVVVPIELVADALIQLVTNAIEADRPTGRLPIVSVRCHVEKRMLVIDISDNGTGMKNVKAGTDLADVSLASTKGHPAEGLVLVATTLAYSRGRATVTGTSKMGTQIRVEFGLRLK